MSTAAELPDPRAARQAFVAQPSPADDGETEIPSGRDPCWAMGPPSLCKHTRCAVTKNIFNLLRQGLLAIRDIALVAYTKETGSRPSWVVGQECLTAAHPLGVLLRDSFVHCKISRGGFGCHTSSEHEDLRLPAKSLQTRLTRMAWLGTRRKST